jgi:NADH-quinone oxidoreductase subunit H
MFFTAALAETNRLPFDLPECEQELVGGFHTEYSGIKFVLFFLAEYTHVVTVSFLTVLLFFGGWHLPGLTEPFDNSWVGYALRWCVLLGKVALVIGLIIQLRWTLPRFRFDQLMGVAWKGLIPLGMLNLVGLAVVLTLDLSKWWLAAYSLFIVLLVGIANVTSNRRSSLSTSRSQTVTEMRAAPYEGA